MSRRYDTPRWRPHNARRSTEPTGARQFSKFLPSPENEHSCFHKAKSGGWARYNQAPQPTAGAVYDTSAPAPHTSLSRRREVQGADTDGEGGKQ
jgi:hypothetical protein